MGQVKWGKRSSLDTTTNFKQQCAMDIVLYNCSLPPRGPIIDDSEIAQQNVEEPQYLNHSPITYK